MTDLASMPETKTWSRIRGRVRRSRPPARFRQLVRNRKQPVRSRQPVARSRQPVRSRRPSLESKGSGAAAPRERRRSCSRRAAPSPPAHKEICDRNGDAECRVSCRHKLASPTSQRPNQVSPRTDPLSSQCPAPAAPMTAPRKLSATNNNNTHINTNTGNHAKAQANTPTPMPGGPASGKWAAGGGGRADCCGGGGQRR